MIAGENDYQMDLGITIKYVSKMILLDKHICYVRLFENSEGIKHQVGCDL